MDKYDKQIEELMAVPAENFLGTVKLSWIDASPLFQFLNCSGRPESNEGGHPWGCPIMVKGLQCNAQTEALTKAVLDSPLIPVAQSEIRQDKNVLEEFARIQRLADVELSRQL